MAKSFLFGALNQQIGEGPGTFGLLADDDARRVQVVVQRLALTQEFRREDDLVATHLFAQGCGIAHRNGRFDDDGGGAVERHDLAHDGLDRRGVELVRHRIVIGRRGDDDDIRAFESLGGVESRLEVQFFVLQEVLDFGIDDRRFPAIEHIDLGRDDIECNHLVMPRQQHGVRKTHITQARNSYLHFRSKIT